MLCNEKELHMAYTRSEGRDEIIYRWGGNVMRACTRGGGGVERGGRPDPMIFDVEAERAWGTSWIPLIFEGYVPRF